MSMRIEHGATVLEYPPTQIDYSPKSLGELLTLGSFASSEIAPSAQIENILIETLGPVCISPVIVSFDEITHTNQLPYKFAKLGLRAGTLLEAIYFKLSFGSSDSFPLAILGSCEIRKDSPRDEGWPYAPVIRRAKKQFFLDAQFGICVRWSKKTKYLAFANTSDPTTAPNMIPKFIFGLR